MAYTIPSIDPLEAYRLARQSSATVPDDLSRSAGKEALLNIAAALLQYNRSGEAYKLYKQLKPIIPALGGKDAGELEAALVYLGFTGMPYFSRAELADFFRERNVTGLFEDYDLVDVPGRLKSTLALVPLEERDAWRKEIWEAWHQNSHGFTGGKSFGEWFKQYDAAVGVDVAETYKRASFESDVEVKAHLAEREKQLLHRLFDLYEFIKLSSESPAGYEEDIAAFEDKGVALHIGQANAPAVEPPSGGAQAPEPAQSAATAYDYSRVLASRDQLLASAQGSAKAVGDALTQSLLPQQAHQALASLLLLAQLRQLDNLMEDQRFSKLVMDDLRKAGRDDMISGMAANPGAPQYIARLLKIVLEDKLNLSHEDAIGFGSRLSKILAMEGDKYQTI
ncbi:MAG: hypothetical protein Q8P78_03105, partial [bacterium]|nr:hypothetical protein [bacterium]